MPIIVFGIFLFCAIKVAAGIKARQREKEMQAEIERRQTAVVDRKIEQARAKIEREQARQAKEIEKHEAWLKKHDEEIAKLQFKVQQAETDIERLTDRISKLYARLDIAQNQQMMAVPGSKADDTAQSKIISLERQIDNAEKQLERAKFDKKQAERKLA